MIKPHRNQPLWYAFILHRFSGIALAVFLPLHFYVLGLSINNSKDFDKVMHWAEQPWVKLAEFGLVFLLAVHLFGGLRLLALEFLPWRSSQKTYAAIAVALAFLLATGFLLRVFQA
ncbi:MAG: succinate dehydrogenase, cytochrome b556 subunit [Gammaproteobacteria bacterium]|nr:succinate dehydrogenase, cytochrome b556 subunit [Gammaproteobacteria bacterium]